MVKSFTGRQLRAILEQQFASATNTPDHPVMLLPSRGLTYSYDLTKPPLLIPILGADRLNAPKVQLGNFSPTIGFAWTATRDGRTVLRGGAGRYVDPVGSTNALNLDNERLALLPLGFLIVIPLVARSLTRDLTPRPPLEESPEPDPNLV